MSPQCIRFVAGEFFLNDSGLTIKSKKDILYQKYLDYFFFLNQGMIYLCGRGVAQKNLDVKAFSALSIPLPPLDIQKKIVAEIEAIEKKEEKAKEETEKLKEIVVNIIEKIYRDTIFKTTLDKVCKIQRGRFSHRPRNEPRFFNGEYPFIQTGDVVKAKGGKINYVQTLNEEGLKVSKLFQPTIVLITIAANIGDTAILDYPACFTDSVVGLIPTELINVYFLELMMRKQKKPLEDGAPQMAQKNINIQILNKVEVPLLPLAEQQKIVSEIEKIESKITTLEKELADLPKQKEAVLKRYL